MPGVERIWLPGEQSEAKRIAYAQQGIPIAPALLAQLNTVSEQLKVPGLLDTAA
jgi:LDH2 family malate/lactate/ureidoglycolate dehydrogenase